MSTKITIISGFLGAGKTTFLKKIIPSLVGKTVVIENEFGSVGIDGDLLNDRLPVREINAGCICCSVVQDFKKAVEELTLEYRPNQILIEPSGVGCLSDILKICIRLATNPVLDIKINHLVTIVDVRAFDDYIENFGGFYLDQIKNANIIFLSHFEKIASSDLERIISIIQLKNPEAFILEEDWISYDGDRLVEIMEATEGKQRSVLKGNPLAAANIVFGSFAFTKPKRFTSAEVDRLLESLKHRELGYILRAKGILELETNEAIIFNYTPHHQSWDYIRETKDCRAVVIGTGLNTTKLKELFGGNGRE